MIDKMLILSILCLWFYLSR